jgi:hypothetical protein
MTTDGYTVYTHRGVEWTSIFSDTDYIDKIPDDVIDVVIAVQQTYPDMKIHPHPTFCYNGRELSVAHPMVQDNGFAWAREDHRMLMLEDFSKRKNYVQYEGDYNIDKILEVIENWRRDVDKRVRAAQKARARKKQKRMEEGTPADMLTGLIGSFYERKYNTRIRGTTVFLRSKEHQFRVAICGWLPGEQGRISVAFKHNLGGNTGEQYVEWEKEFNIIPEDPKWNPEVFMSDIDETITRMKEFVEAHHKMGWERRRLWTR